MILYPTGLIPVGYVYCFVVQAMLLLIVFTTARHLQSVINLQLKCNVSSLLPVLPPLSER